MPMSTRDAQFQQELLRIGQVAEAFNVAVSTVRAWERTGKIAAVRTPGNQRRFRRADVEALLAGTIQAAS